MCESCHSRSLVTQVWTWFVLDLSHGGSGVEISCCVLQFAVARRPFVEPRVSSSGETWQAKLIEIVIISVARG